MRRGWIMLCVVVALGSVFRGRSMGDSRNTVVAHATPLSASVFGTAKIERPDALHRVGHALRASERHEQSTRILYLGDSHVATDRLTEQLRTRLQARFGDGGIGYFHPARPWRDYRHAGVVLRGANAQGWHVASRRDRAPNDSTGFGGYALVADTDNASDADASLEVTFSTPTAADGIATVYALGSDAGGTLTLHVDHATPSTLVTRGPARLLTQTVNVPAQATTLRVFAAEGPVQLLGVAHEHRAPGVIVDVAGVVGARTGDVLRTDRTVLNAHLAARAPDLLVLGFGTNDAMDTGRSVDDHVREIETVVLATRAAVPNAACLLVGPSDHPQRAGRRRLTDRAQTQRVIAAQRVVAERHHCALIDLVALTGGPLSMLTLVRRDPPLSARDLIHFTPAGYHAIGTAIADGLIALVERP